MEFSKLGQTLRNAYLQNQGALLYPESEDAVELCRQEPMNRYTLYGRELSSSLYLFDIDHILICFYCVCHYVGLSISQMQFAARNER
jgi:hypothetical protein